MAYQVHDRIIEGAMIDRMTDGSRGLSDYDQRDLARRGLMPSKQQLINNRLSEMRYNQGVLKEQRLRNDALEQNNQQTTQPSYQQIYNQNKAKLAQTTQAPNTATRSNGQSGYRYNIDYQAAQDAGKFLRALKGETGTADKRQYGKPDLKLATELLNKTPYSSINTAQGIAIDTDDKGNQVVSFMGPENAVLGKIPMAQLEQQLSNLNNYASREGVKVTPGRVAMFDSEELAAGAEAARQAAIDPQNLLMEGYNVDEAGRYTRPGKSGGFETLDVGAIGQKAYDGYIQKYGPQQPSVTPDRDTNFDRTQTPVTMDGGYNLGFSTASRYQPKPTTGGGGYKGDPMAEARRLAGVGGKNAGDSAQDDLPAPQERPSYAAQQISNPNPQRGYGGFLGIGNIGAAPQQAPSFNQQESAFIKLIQPYLNSGGTPPWSDIQRLAQQQGLPTESFQKIFHSMRG